MRYKNNRTGAVIDSPSVISGVNWTEIKTSQPKKVVEQVVEPKPQEDVKKDTRTKKRR